MKVFENNKVLWLILVAFVFSFSVRMIWVYQNQNNESYKYNNQFMINTNDGYYFAEGARDIINPPSYQNERSPIHTALAKTTAYITKLLPFDLETVIFYMPAFFSSLVVIPLILIGHSINRLDMGFIAALLASIANSYYNRTMVGYYDTDMLNIVLPTILVWSLVWAIRTREDKYLLITALDIIVYRWWYPQSYSLEFAFFSLIVLYVIYRYLKKEEFKYELVLASFMLLAMIGLDNITRLISVLVLFAGYKYKKELFYTYTFYLFLGVFVLFFLTGGLDPIIKQLKAYVFQSSVDKSNVGLNLHFFSVMQTIKEANHIPFETFANRISGHVVVFLVSLVGYALLIYRYPVMLIGLPMLGLGFLAYFGGLRFTIYAVPILALGLGYFIIKVSSYIPNKIAGFATINILAVLALLPNIKHIQNYNVSTVFVKDEVKALHRLKQISKPTDYTIAWWDYGYPIRFYSQTKTTSDGGLHSGAVNFPTSYILTNTQKEAANMLRLDVEYTEKRATNKSYDKSKSNIENMTMDFGFKNTNDFLESLDIYVELPKKTTDVYLYLPYRMMDIYGSISLFSNLDLMSGKKFKKPLFYKTTKYKVTKDFIDLENNIKYDRQRKKIIIGNKVVPVRNFTITKYDKKSNLNVTKSVLNKKANLNLIYMKNYNKFLLLDNQTYDSTYIQLFVLQNYDKRFFRPVIYSPLVKIYKLKI